MCGNPVKTLTWRIFGKQNATKIFSCIFKKYFNFLTILVKNYQYLISPFQQAKFHLWTRYNNLFYFKTLARTEKIKDLKRKKWSSFVYFKKGYLYEDIDISLFPLYSTATNPLWKLLVIFRCHKITVLIEKLKNSKFQKIKVLSHIKDEINTYYLSVIL